MRDEEWAEALMHRAWTTESWNEDRRAIDDALRAARIDELEAAIKAACWQCARCAPRKDHSAYFHLEALCPVSALHTRLAELRSSQSSRELRGE